MSKKQAPFCPICKKIKCSGAFGYPCDGLLNAPKT